MTDDKAVLNDEKDSQEEQTLDTPEVVEEEQEEEVQEENYRDTLVQDRIKKDRNKAFAQLRKKEKEYDQLQQKIEALESKFNDDYTVNTVDEQALLDKLEKKLEEKQKREQAELEKARAEIAKEEESLKSKGLNKSQVNQVLLYARDYTGGNIKKAYSLYKEFNKNQQPKTTNVKPSGTQVNKKTSNNDVTKKTWNELMEDIKNDMRR